MNPVVVIDSREFQKAAQDLLKTSSRSAVDFANGQMLFVASNAIKLTKKAQRNKIERELGILRKTEKLRSGDAGAKGWVRITNRVLKEDSYAQRILIARHKATGKWGIKGGTLKEKALNLIKAKVRSVAFIKSGWIPAVRTLSNIVYRKPRIEKESISVIKLGADKGWALPAIPSQTNNGHAVCTIANTALNAKRHSTTWHGKAGDPMPVAVQGLRAAMDLSTKDMIETLAKRLARDLKPYQAK